MSYHTRIAHAFQKAKVLDLTNETKYILFSDCHRGTGAVNDNFVKNEFLFLAALEYYDRKKYIYLELGDGDELWENRSMEGIKEMHKHTFEMLAKFYDSNRLQMIYGNHDMVKKNRSFSEKNFQTYFCDTLLRKKSFCPELCCHSGIILKDAEKQRDIYLLHGHQAELLNSTFWKLARLLVRYIWKNLELLGVPDPTSAAKNNTRKERTERRLANWARQNQHILISGHTHRPMVGTKKSPYFNTGSCIHPAGITGIEIEERRIALVKWSLSTREDQSVYVKREILGEPVSIDALF